MRGLLTMCLILVLATLTEVSVAEAGDEALPRLRFNPFERPDFQAREGSYAGEAAATGPSAWSPVLTATLVAGDASLANLGGILLAVGEETHGYRLLEVREWEAVFEYKGQRLELRVAAAKGDAP